MISELTDRMLDQRAIGRLLDLAATRPTEVFSTLRELRPRPTDLFFDFLNDLEVFGISPEGELRPDYRAFLEEFPDRVLSDVILRLGIPKTASTYLQGVDAERFDNVLLLSLKHSDLGVSDFANPQDLGIPRWEQIVSRLGQLSSERSVCCGIRSGISPERWILVHHGIDILCGRQLPEADQPQQEWLVESLDLDRFSDDLSLLILWRLMTRHPHTSFYRNLLPQLFGGLRKLERFGQAGVRLREHIERSATGSSRTEGP